MSEIRESQVSRIDAAHRALSEARREHGDHHPSVQAADEALNALVFSSSSAELNAWAARANARVAEAATP